MDPTTTNLLSPEFLAQLTEPLGPTSRLTQAVEVANGSRYALDIDAHGIISPGLRVGFSDEHGIEFGFQTLFPIQQQLHFQSPLTATVDFVITGNGYGAGLLTEASLTRVE